MSNETEPQGALLCAISPTIERIPASPSVETSNVSGRELADLIGRRAKLSPPRNKDLLANLARLLAESDETFTIYAIEAGGSLIAGGDASLSSHLVLSGSARIESRADLPPLRELLPGDYAGPHAVLVSSDNDTKILAIPSELLLRCGSIRVHDAAPARPVSLSGREVSRAVLDQALDALIRERATALIGRARGVASILNPWRQAHVDRSSGRLLTLSEQHSLQLRACERLMKDGATEIEILETALACRKEAYQSAALARDLTEAIHDCESQLIRLESRRTSGLPGAGCVNDLDRHFRQRADALAEARKELDARLASLIKRRDKEIGVGKRELLVQTAHDLFTARAEKAMLLTGLASKIADELEREAPAERRAELLAERFLSRGPVVAPDSKERLLEAALNFSSLLDLGLTPSEIRSASERLLRIRWLERTALAGGMEAAAPANKGASFHEDLFGLLRLATDSAQLGILLDARLDEALASARELEDDVESLRERLQGKQAPLSIVPASRDTIVSERSLQHDSGPYIALERLRSDLRSGRRSDFPAYAAGLFARSLLDCLAEGRLRCVLFAGAGDAALEFALAKFGEPREQSVLAPLPRLDGGPCGALVTFSSGRQVLVLPCEDADDLLQLAAALVNHDSLGSRIPRDRLELAGALPETSFTTELETLFYRDFHARCVSGRLDLNEQLEAFGRKLHHEVVPTQLVFLEDSERDLPRIFGEDLERGSGGPTLTIFYVRDKESGNVTRVIAPKIDRPVASLTVSRWTEAFLAAEIGHKNPNVLVHYHGRVRGLEGKPAPREGQLFASLGPPCGDSAPSDALLSRLAAPHKEKLTRAHASLRPTPLFLDPDGKDLELIDHLSAGVHAAARSFNRESTGLVKRYGPMTVTVLVTHRQDAGRGACAPGIAGSPFSPSRHALSPSAATLLRSLFSLAGKEYRTRFSAHDFKNEGR